MGCIIRAFLARPSGAHDYTAGVKFGIVFANSGPGTTPEHAAGLARIAEETGFESLWTVEHVVVPAGHASAYPYSRSGRMPGGEDVPIPDPIVWLSFVAAHTKTLVLGTGILILPQRNPVVLAKAAATLDVLSNGRFQLGVGVGWLKEEFDALGVPFEERGRRTDEYIAALRVLWKEPEPSFKGRFVSFDKAKSYPKPLSPNGIPIVIGGHSSGAARRAGRLGDGFFPALTTPEKLEPLIAEMNVAATGAGRDPAAIEITCGGAFDAEGVERFAAIGVSRIVIPPPAWDLEGLKEGLGRFSEDVIGKSTG